MNGKRRKAKQDRQNSGKCSADWRKAKKQIEADAKMKKELIAKLQTLI